MTDDNIRIKYIMANKTTYLIFENYYQEVPEDIEIINEMKKSLSGIYLTSDSLLVCDKYERKSLLDDLSTLIKQIPVADNLFKEAQKDYTAGYMDYDANSKAYILDHALASIESAIGMLTSLVDYQLAKGLLSSYNEFRNSIIKEHPFKN